MKQFPNTANMGSKRRLAPLTEGPFNDDAHPNKPHSWTKWLKSQLLFFSHKKSDLKILLGVLACPLSPVSVDPTQLPDVDSQARYIIQQFTAATGFKKVDGLVKSVYVVGTVKMGMIDELGSSSGKVGTGVPQNGCFVMWQMLPDKWLVEIAVSGQKIVAGSDGKTAWRHTPWLGSHAAKGGVRPPRRSLQGLDPATIAAVFSHAQYVGEKRVAGEDCFVLKLATDYSTLADRSDATAEIIKHVIIGYFSQRSGLLVYLEDSHLTRIQSPGNHATYWETSIASRIEDYRAIDGVKIAHSGHSTVSLARFGDQVKISPLTTRMEETWTIDDVAFNVPGLSMDCFLPPAELLVASSSSSSPHILS